MKDKKWSYEQERRYVIFINDGYKYNEINIDDLNYLKLKTTLLLLPDFILGQNPVKPFISEMINSKRYRISTKSYLFCEDCFNIDYDSVVFDFKKVTECPICYSKKVKIENFDLL